MLGARLGDGGSVQQKLGRAVAGRADIENFGSAEGEGTSFVEKNGVDFAQFFEIKTAFDDRSLLRGAADGAEDRQWCACCDATGARNDYHRNGRTNVVRDQKRQDRRTERKVHQIACQAVGNALNRCAGLFRSFYRFNDFPEGSFPAEAFDAQLKCAGLIDGAGIDGGAGLLLDRHRLAGDGRLVDEGMASHHLAVNRDAATRLHQHNVLRRDFGDVDVGPSSVPANGCRIWKKID